MVSTIRSVSEFQTQLDSAGNKLVILDFYATWCGPCKEMDPHVRQLVKQYKERAIVMKINVDKFHELSDYYKIKSMPTFIFIKNKKRLSSFTGADVKLLTLKMASLTK